MMNTKGERVHSHSRLSPRSRKTQDYLPSKSTAPITRSGNIQNTTNSISQSVRYEPTTNLGSDRSRTRLNSNTPLSPITLSSPRSVRKVNHHSTSSERMAILSNSNPVGNLVGNRPLTPSMTRKSDDMKPMNIPSSSIRFTNTSDKLPHTPKYGRRSVSPEVSKGESSPSGRLGNSSSVPQTLSPIRTSFLPNPKNSNSNFNNSNDPLPLYNMDKMNQTVSDEIKKHNPIDNERVTTTIGITTSYTSHHSSTSIPSSSSRQLPAIFPDKNIISLKPHQGLVGLRNLGNTCYMNSILQCLSATDSLTYIILNKENAILKKAKSKGIVQGYVDLVKQMWVHDRTGSSVAPSMFKQRLQRLAPQFQGYDQHDSQEFLRFLLSGLHDELNLACTTKETISPSPRNSTDNEKADRAWKRTLAFDNSEISAIFMGQLKSTLKCLTCNHISITFDPFWDLSLPIPSSPSSSVTDYRTTISPTSSFGSDITLQDCFKLFTAMEKLDKDNKPLCEKCNSLQPGTKQLGIQRFPQILVIHLKRFSGIHFRTKLSTNVKFKQEMSLTSDDDGLSVQYQLYAISNHSGSCYGGHYTAYCKHPVQLKWYHFNDSSVAPITNTSIHCSQAYVLFYKKTSSQT